MLTSYEYEAPYCCGEDITLPNGVNISRGTAFATCDFCSFKCAYWECPCELVHECEGN